MERITIRNIKEKYVIWKNIIELDYELLGLADDIFVSPVKYYFNPSGFGLILSGDILIVSGKNKDAVRREVLRLEKKMRLIRINQGHYFTRTLVS